MNEYQSIELHASSDTFFALYNGEIYPVRYTSIETNSYFYIIGTNSAGAGEYVFNNRSTVSSNIDAGKIQFTNTEDISKFTSFYNTIYGEPIELDASYLDMISNAKKLQVNCQIKAAFSGTNNVNVTGSITGSFDCSMIGLSNAVAAQGLACMTKVRDTKVSRLDGTYYTVLLNRFGEVIPEFRRPYTSPTSPTGGIVSFSAVDSQDLLPEVHGYLTIFASRDSEGNIVNDLSVSRSVSSQNAGNLSANFTSSDEFRMRFSFFVAHILVTPSKIYAWVAVGADGYARQTGQSPQPARSYFSFAGVPHVFNFPSAGETSVRFLGKDIPIIVEDHGEEPFSLSLSGTTFDITKTEDYPT